MSNASIRLAERVRQLRLQAGLTQAQLASSAGVTVETVARLERVVRGRASANANPSLETIERLSAALGVDLPDLLRAPGRSRPRGDRLTALIQNVSPEMQRVVLRVVEALVQEPAAKATARARGRKRRG